MSTFESEKIWSTNNYGRYMYVSCSQTTNGSSANTSTISWTITTAGGGSSYYDTGPTYLWIGGVERYSKARTYWTSGEFPAKAGSTSGSYTISHNDDGTISSQEVKLKSAIFTGEWNSTTVTGTWTLDKIDRYFSSTPSISLKSRTETTITLNWSTSETCSAISWYGYKSGAKVTVTGLPGKSGTVTFGDSSTTSEKLDADTTYKIYGKFTRSDSSMQSNSSTGSYTTYDYPYVKSVGTTNLTIGNSQTLELYNPLSRTVTIKMYTSGGSLLYTSGSTTSTSITFTPTALNLYKSIPSNQSASCYYAAVCSSPSHTQNTSSSYTYKVTGNEKPTLNINNVLTYDANTDVTDITNQTSAGGWLVQGLSKLKVAITAAASTANSNDGSTISKYEVTFAGTTKTLSVGTTGGTWGVFNGSGSQTITIKVTDSRQLSNTYTKTVNFIAYRAPSISLSASRETNYLTANSDKVYLSVAYTGSDVSGTNGVKVWWRRTDTGATGYFTGSSSSFDITESNTKTATITGLANDKAYTFEAIIEDKFGNTATSTEPVSIARAAMFVDVEQSGVGVNCLPSGAGLYVHDNLRVNGKRLLQRFNMDLSDYSTDNFYPVVFDVSVDRIDCEITSPSLSGGAAWNQNAISFSMKWTGWSDTPKSLHIYHYGVYDANEITIGCIGGGNHNGHLCVWLRGGMNYSFYSNHKATLRESGYTAGDEYYSVGTNYYGGSNSYVSIYFTPQSTINSGAYISNHLRVNGNLRGGWITCDDTMEVNGTFTGKDTVYTDGYFKSPLGLTKDETCALIGEQNNELNFGGTNASDTIFFGYRAAGSRPKPVKYVFGSGSGTAGAWAASFYKQGVDVPAITISSSAPSAKQTGDIWVTS